MLPDLQMGILSCSEVHFLVIWSSEAAKPGLELQSCALAGLGCLPPQTPMAFQTPCPSFAWRIHLLLTEATWRLLIICCPATTKAGLPAWGWEHS